MDESKVIVVQMDCIMRREEIECVRKELIEQMAEGIVVVPGYAHVEYVGEASDVVIVDNEDTCKNIGEDYAECDQFVCSACGIELQDWHRVERDMDDGEVSYHEYTFRFCPHCGRKIVEGAEEE